jgi:hypothetical protein
VDSSVKENTVLRCDGPESNIAMALQTRVFKCRRLDLDVDGVALPKRNKRRKVESYERTFGTSIDCRVEIG